MHKWQNLCVTWKAQELNLQCIGPNIKVSWTIDITRKSTSLQYEQPNTKIKDVEEGVHVAKRQTHKLKLVWL